MEFENQGAISGKAMVEYENAKYLVKTIVPLVDNPYCKNYLFSFNEYMDFSNDLFECAEFIVSVDVLL